MLLWSFLSINLQILCCEWSRRCLWIPKYGWAVALEKNNTHFAYYGEYAVAFSKSWGEGKHLQPVHYLNKDSQYAKDFSALFERILQENDIPEEYSQDVINRLAYIKPLRGIMKRRIIRSDSSSATVEICKNFHDEREWRYVPNPDVLTALNTASIIANPHIIPLANEISKGLEQETYRKLWLDFSYDDIRYIIVPEYPRSDWYYQNDKVQFTRDYTE